ncbi:MAG: prolipoprotein diacylglyceryl transferase, partial [Acidobacteria bacterium]|nr:prolipoprotein diacylglyceryl transferase [Acidobacteriota bacterium]
RKGADGRWGGANLTWYGFLVATAYGVAAAVAVLLLGSVGLSTWQVVFFLGGLLAVAVPAASGVARWVEKKPATFTVGGAVFVSLLAAPLVLALVERLSGAPMPFRAALAGLAVAYLFGEGLGRLACLSFGCCYGKPLHELPTPLAWLFRPIAAVFHGPTKKISYASDLEGVPVVPIQALTCSVLLTLGWLSLQLFVAGRPTASLALSLGGSQLWRVLSETLRADHRGGRSFSAYQWMALAGGLAVLGALGAAPALAPVAVSLPRGWGLLWRPGSLLVLQALWLAVFLHTGWSRMTSSVLSFHVREDWA